MIYKKKFNFPRGEDTRGGDACIDVDDDDDGTGAAGDVDAVSDDFLACGCRVAASS